MKIALASPPFPESIEDGMHWVEEYVRIASKQQTELICFPESFIPGLRGMEFRVEAHNPIKLQWALERAKALARDFSIAIILPMDWDQDGKILNLAFVISAEGKLLGSQTKNQLDPTEDEIFIPGTKRHLFVVNDIKIGITICHEGFRYPESVRWAARQGAKIVFHPHCTGSNSEGVKLTQWGERTNPYYEKAMMMRSKENTIYFASVNYGLQYQESASSVIGPNGECICYQPYGIPGVLIQDIDTNLATGLLAKRFNADQFE